MEKFPIRNSARDIDGIKKSLPRGFLAYLEKSEKIIRTIDHLVYVTFPLIKDKRLLLKILLEEKEAVINCINSVLQYEYLHKRISLHEDSTENFIIFREKCAPKYSISREEINLISELFALVKVHNESDFEFYRREKVIMLSGNLKTKISALS